MNPTPEQVVAWAREAGVSPLMQVFGVHIERLLTHAMAEQAEQDAHTCDLLSAEVDKYPADCAAAIRANAPKGKM